MRRRARVAPLHPRGSAHRAPSGRRRRHRSSAPKKRGTARRSRDLRGCALRVAPHIPPTRARRDGASGLRARVDGCGGDGGEGEGGAGRDARSEKSGAVHERRRRRRRCGTDDVRQRRRRHEPRGAGGGAS